MSEKYKKLLIAVPSKGRAEDIWKNTLSWLQYVEFCDWKIFVEPQDYEDYKKTIPEENLVNIGHNNRKLGYSKLKILEYARNNDYDYIFKMDDDITNFTFKETWGNEEFKKAPKEEKKKTVAILFELCLTDCVGVFRKHPEIGLINFAHSSDLFNKKEIRAYAKLNSFMGSIYLLRRELIMSKRMQADADWENLQVCFNANEDNVTFLSVIEEGFYTLKRNDMIFSSQEMGKNQGGCQSFDRATLHSQATTMLKEKYFPKLDTKNFRNWIVPDWSKHIKGMSIKEEETIKQALERYKSKHLKRIEEFLK